MSIDTVILSIIAVLLFVFIFAIFYIALTLKIVANNIDRLAGISHYQQASPFSSSSKADKAPVVKRASKPIVDNELVDFNDLPDEIAMRAIEDWNGAS
jgi:hypothetical protein